MDVGVSGHRQLHNKVSASPTSIDGFQRRGKLPFVSVVYSTTSFFNYNILLLRDPVRLAALAYIRWSEGHEASVEAQQFY